MEQEWLLGEGLSLDDNLIDPFTFGDLVLQVHCNCEKITPDAVKRELAKSIATRLEDTMFLLDRNMERIMDEANKGREY